MQTLAVGDGEESDKEICRQRANFSLHYLQTVPKLSP
jgi:hypothetical protein